MAFRFRIAGGFATVGGLSIAVSSVQDRLTYLSLPPWAYDIVLVMGIASAAGAIAIIILPMMAHPLVSEYELALARRADLQHVHNLGKIEIGDSVVTLKTLHEWYSVNRKSIWIVWRQPRSLLFRKRTMVGFFSVFPILRDAADKLRKNREGGYRVTAESIAPEGIAPSALYVSAVAARGFRPRGVTLGQMVAYVAARGLEVPEVYAAPSTFDGLRIVERHDLKPTDSTTAPLETVFHRHLRRDPLT